MKPISLPLCAGAVCAALLGSALPLTSQGQAGADPAAEEAAAAQMLVSLVAQQTTISENQAKIETTIVHVSEQVRQARLFVARGGGASK